MSDVHLRARSVSELVDAAFALYRRDGLRYIQVAAIAYAPWLVAQIIFQGETPTLTTGQFPTAGALLVPILLGVGSWLSYILMSAVIIKVGSQVYLGQAPDLGGTVREVAPRVGTILVGSLLKYALLFVVILGVGIAAAITGGTLFRGTSIGVGVGAVMIVGSLGAAFYIFARYFAVTQVIVLEGASAWQALGRSTTLSQGRKRHVLNTMMLVGVIYIMLAIGVQVLARVTSSVVITLVVSTAFTIVSYPIIGLTQMLLYYDTRIRGEGFDIEVMAGALDGLPAAGGVVT